MIRLLKTVIVLFVALVCIFYATQNVANLESMKGALSYVMSNQDHEVYVTSFGPAITNPYLVAFAVVIVLIGEFSAGLISLKGAWDMFRARGASADEFQTAKKWALTGSLVGVLTWFGLFMAVGGAYFQMWQTAVGAESHSGAFTLAAVLGIIFLIVQSRDN